VESEQINLIIAKNVRKSLMQRAEFEHEIWALSHYFALILSELHHLNSLIRFIFCVYFLFRDQDPSCCFNLLLLFSYRVSLLFSFCLSLSWYKPPPVRISRSPSILVSYFHCHFKFIPFYSEQSLQRLHILYRISICHTQMCRFYVNHGITLWILLT